MSDKFTLTSQFLYILMGLISLFIAREFWKSRDGVFRKLMIFFFLAQFWVVGASASYYFLTEKFNVSTYYFGVIRLLALLPITISMVLIFIYLARKNKKKNGKYYS